MPPKLIESLPQLVAEGLITPEQADRIRTRYGADDARGASRMLLVFAVLGSLLVGLGLILIVAHNWDDFSRTTRTVLAIAPVLLGQALVMVALRKGPEARAWREGSAVLLACALCACVALISQIYHIDGSLDGYLLTCALLILPLLYLPGSLITALGYLALVTWQAAAYHFDRPGPDAPPWMALVLLAAAVPMYLREAHVNGERIGFWWLSLFAAVSLGLISQWFHRSWSITHIFGLMAMASAFTLVPWLHPGRAWRTWPWVLVGGATVLVTFLVLSYRDPWGFNRDWPRMHLEDPLSIGILAAIGVAAYALSLRRRKPFERWPYPESLAFFAICYGAGLLHPWLAPLLVNAAMLTMGVFTVREGISRDSMRRMNLGLAIIGLTVILRFLDTDMSFALRGLAFMAVGGGFLYMNLRMVRARDRQKHG
ncbi:MAG: DUF2157 domain-containing protein [Flavobacteriales bacterium]|nr:DUF2157 domain-containing protein [Flavobacteriales bacterium]